MKRLSRVGILLGALSTASCYGTGGELEPGADDVDTSADEVAAARPEDTFRNSTRFAVVNPKTYGARGNGTTNDAPALVAAVDALPAAGGVVLFPSGTYLKDRTLWYVRKNHVLLWAPNGRATLHGTIRPETAAEAANANFCGVRQQSTIFQKTLGGGVFGLRFTSNLAKRDFCGESNQLVADSVDGFEMVGTEVASGPGCALFTTRSNAANAAARNIFVEGNYSHHTWADSYHQTAGTRRTWVWGNYIFNEAPSLGDDGVACVTYNPGSPRCGEMEWFNNVYLGGAHGRGMAVVGGEDVLIHHNWIIGSASAGLIVASESAYQSETVARVELRSNYLVRSPNGSVNNGHSAILISGGNTLADPIRNVTAIDNVVVSAPSGRVQRAEGRIDAATVTFTNTRTDAASLPGPQPTRAQARPRDTSVLRTRDLSWVPAAQRKGLYRIHLREGAAGLQERFEYLVTGPSAQVSTFISQAQRDQGIYLSENRAGTALLLSPVPLTVPAALQAVTFEQLRIGDRNGTLSWLWARVDSGVY